MSTKETNILSEEKYEAWKAKEQEKIDLFHQTFAETKGLLTQAFDSVSWDIETTKLFNYLRSTEVEIQKPERMPPDLKTDAINKIYSNEKDAILFLVALSTLQTIQDKNMLPENKAEALQSAIKNMSQCMVMFGQHVPVTEKVPLKHKSPKIPGRNFVKYANDEIDTLVKVFGDAQPEFKEAVSGHYKKNLQAFVNQAPEFYQ